MASRTSNGKVKNGKPTAMTWVAGQKRWIKMYRGKTYAVSCRQLGTEATKEASRIPANEWWEKKRAKIDEELGLARKHPVALVNQYQYAIENHRLYAKWLRKYGNAPDGVAKSEAMIDFLTEALKGDNPPFPLKRFMEHPLWEVLTPLNEYEVKKLVVWQERLFQIRREEREEQSVPKENTVRSHIDDYLTFRRSKVGAGENVLGTFDTYRTRLLVFREWVSPFAPVVDLNESLWERYYSHLAEQCEKGKLANTTAGGHFNAAKEFIKSRYSKRLIELPRNIDEYSFSRQLEEIVVFTIDEVKLLLSHCHTERDTLFILLMLNAGFYGVDIGKLTKDEYKDGHIIRKRSKTRKRSKKVPVVDYPLWEQTRLLLEKQMSNHPTLMLTNSNGDPLWVESEKQGKFVRSNNIKCAVSRIKARAGITKPTKSLRKTSATLLGSHPVYGKFTEYFLGEAPTTMTQTHYEKPDDEQFAKAVEWLGVQYGVVGVKATEEQEDRSNG